MAARISGEWMGHTGRSQKPRSRKTLTPTAPSSSRSEKRVPTSSSVATSGPPSEKETPPPGGRGRGPGRGERWPAPARREPTLDLIRNRGVDVRVEHGSDPAGEVGAQVLVAQPAFHFWWV